MKHSLLCPDCERLEREYQLTIVEIYSVVGGRFKTVGEKLRELFPIYARRAIERSENLISFGLEEPFADFQPVFLVVYAQECVLGRHLSGSV